MLADLMAWHNALSFSTYRVSVFTNLANVVLQLARGDTKAQAAFDARTNRIFALIPGGPTSTVQLIIRIEDLVSAFAVVKHLGDRR